MPAAGFGCASDRSPITASSPCSTDSGDFPTDFLASRDQNAQVEPAEAVAGAGTDKFAATCELGADEAAGTEIGSAGASSIMTSRVAACVTMAGPAAATMLISGVSVLGFAAREPPGQKYVHMLPDVVGRSGKSSAREPWGCSSCISGGSTSESSIFSRSGELAPTSSVTGSFVSPRSRRLAHENHPGGAVGVTVGDAARPWAKAGAPSSAAVSISSAAGAGAGAGAAALPPSLAPASIRALVECVVGRDAGSAVLPATSPGAPASWFSFCGGAVLYLARPSDRFDARARKNVASDPLLSLGGASLAFRGSKRLRLGPAMGSGVSARMVSRATCVDAADLGARGHEPYQLRVF